jgi:DNA helicase INO80
MREMLVFWKKNEKEERDVRKRENKEAADRAKIEEEKREVARQARKLEFLISQTELYSHFVGNKLKSEHPTKLSLVLRKLMPLNSCRDSG